MIRGALGVIYELLIDFPSLGLAKVDLPKMWGGWRLTLSFPLPQKNQPKRTLPCDEGDEVHDALTRPAVAPDSEMCGMLRAVSQNDKLFQESFSAACHLRTRVVGRRVEGSCWVLRGSFWPPLWAPSISYPDYSSSFLGLPFKCHTRKAWSHGCCSENHHRSLREIPVLARLLGMSTRVASLIVFPREHLFSKPPRWGMKESEGQRG